MIDIIENLLFFINILGPILISPLLDRFYIRRGEHAYGLLINIAFIISLGIFNIFAFGFVPLPSNDLGEARGILVAFILPAYLAITLALYVFLFVAVTLILRKFFKDPELFTKKVGLRPWIVSGSLVVLWSIILVGIRLYFGYRQRDF